MCACVCVCKSVRVCVCKSVRAKVHITSVHLHVLKTAPFLAHGHSKYSHWSLSHVVTPHTHTHTHAHTHLVQARVGARLLHPLM